MERVAHSSLLAWKHDVARKPLILRGARQVGKTWLLREFGRREYERTAYVNCQGDPSATAVFAGRLEADQLLRGLAIAAGTEIEPDSTLLIIDEIQEAPAALTALKYLQEQRPDIHVVAAGSLLGVALRSSGASFPVGKVAFLDLHPLDFDEFLRAVGEEALADLVTERDWGLIDPFHDRLVELLRQYLFVGGMPEPVARFAATGSFEDARRLQDDILAGYANDFATYAPPLVSRRIAEAWASLPAQLAREQGRYIFSHIRDGARARDFAEAVQWLSDSGLVHRVPRFSKPASPLSAYVDARIFKLFLLDVGLLGALSRLAPSVLLQGEGIFEEFKGALTEQYVLQQIVAARHEEPAYWSSEKASAEVDFAIERAGHVVPIEVKATTNVKSKSLRSYLDRFHPRTAWRFSLARFREQGDVTNIPLYAIGPALRREG